MTNTLRIETEEGAIEVQVPSSWDEITVKQYAEIQKLLSWEGNALERSIKILSELTGVEEDVFFAMYPEQFAQVGELISFMNTEVPQKKKESIILEGEEYFLMTNLEKLTLGESISLELIIEKSKDNVLAHFPEMLCIFLRKKKDNGKLEAFKNSFMEREELFGSISITDVNHLFFSTLSTGTTSTPNMKEFLEKEKK